MIRYVLYSLAARAGSFLTTLAVLATTTAATTVMVSSLEAVEHAVEATGRPDNAVILARGAQTERESKLSPEVVAQLKVFPGARRHGDEAMVSAEYVTLMSFVRDGALPAPLTVRGVDPIALAIRPNVEIVDGALPARGMPGVVVGAQRLGRFRDLRLGGTVRIGRERWPVVGVLRSGGSTVESEIWCDRTALMANLRKSSVTSALVSVSDVGSLPLLERSLQRFPEQPDVVPEPAFQRRTLDKLSFYVKVVRFVILILGAAAVLACMNALHASFLSRVREFATLLAIGYTRRRVGLIVVQESFLLALCGGLLGVLVARLGFQGQGAAMAEVGLVYKVTISGRAVLLGAALTAAIGALSSLLALLELRRMQVLALLRS